MRQGLLRYRCLCGNSHNLMGATLDETQARRISDLPATLKSAMLPRRLRRPGRAAALSTVDTTGPAAVAAEVRRLHTS